MALRLPPNFKNDIQGNSVALIPLVRIGNYYPPADDNFIFLSTNAYTDAGDIYYKPLLLNVPSLKESTDLEKRNYKISSVNIDITNLPYDGVRFSELIDENSLINKECRIWWASPSASNAYPYDDIATYPTLDDDAAMLIYFGTIRRYEHDDEKVRLVLEDRSQSALHKHLPDQPADAGQGNIPDKYKNSKIPIVYGHVDRSPVVPHYSPTEEVSTDEGEIVNVLEYRLKADTQNVDFLSNEETISIGNQSHITSSLFFYENDSYHNVHRTNVGIGNTVGVENFRYGNTDIVLDVDTADYPDVGTGLVNDFSEGLLRVHAVRRFNDIEGIIATQPVQSNDDLTVDITGAYLGRMYGAINLQGSGSNQDYTHCYLKCYLEPITVPDNLEVDPETGVVIKPTTWLFKHITHYNFRTANDISPSNDTNIPSTTNTYSGSLIPASYTHWGAWNTADYIDFNPNENIAGDGSVNNLYPNSYNNISGENWEEDWGYNPNIDTLNWWLTLTTHDHIKIGIPRHRFIYSGLSDEEIDAQWGTWGVDTTVHDAFIVQEYRVMGITDKDFYANVTGRLGEPTAPQIIEHIVENELNPDIDITLPDYEFYTDWKYAFTVDKKINSKKLIEEIAAASPYLPRFNNMGELKFDVIPYGGGSTIVPSDNRTIHGTDVIDFSFSRTPIEDVYTKVGFEWNWDYALGGFTKNLKDTWFDADFITIEDITGANEGVTAAYDFGYYGLKGEDGLPTHKELIIDDDRGKYIRDPLTAGRFACWMLSWHCNQHLKMKVKLPLKYMHLEIGDLIDFSEILGGVAPYGIDYCDPSQYNNVNGQGISRNFMIFKTNKTLEYCEIECIHMHHLYDGGTPSGSDDCAEGFDECGICGGNGTACAEECSAPNYCENEEGDCEPYPLVNWENNSDYFWLNSPYIQSPLVGEVIQACDCEEYVELCPDGDCSMPSFENYPIVDCNGICGLHVPSDYEFWAEWLLYGDDDPHWDRVFSTLGYGVDGLGTDECGNCGHMVYENGEMVYIGGKTFGVGQQPGDLDCCESGLILTDTCGCQEGDFPGEAECNCCGENTESICGSGENCSGQYHNSHWKNVTSIHEHWHLDMLGWTNPDAYEMFGLSNNYGYPGVITETNCLEEPNACSNVYLDGEAKIGLSQEGSNNIDYFPWRGNGQANTDTMTHFFFDPSVNGVTNTCNSPSSFSPEELSETCWRDPNFSFIEGGGYSFAIGARDFHIRFKPGTWNPDHHNPMEDIYKVEYKIVYIRDTFGAQNIFDLPQTDPASGFQYLCGHVECGARDQSANMEHPHSEGTHGTSYLSGDIPWGATEGSGYGEHLAVDKWYTIEGEDLVWGEEGNGNQILKLWEDVGCGYDDDGYNAWLNCMDGEGDSKLGVGLIAFFPQVFENFFYYGQSGGVEFPGYYDHHFRIVVKFHSHGDYSFIPDDFTSPNFPLAENFGTDNVYINTYDYRVRFMGEPSSMGDVNGDGEWNVLDVVLLANCIMGSNCPDLPDAAAGDMNGDGGWNVLDIVALVNCILANNCGL